MKTMIRKILHWLYRNFAASKQREHTVSDKRRIAQGVRKFFEQNYDLRYNVLKQTEEFRRKATCQNRKATYGNGEPPYDAGEPLQWKQLTDREFRKIAIEQMEQVGVAWSIDVELFVRSAIVHNYNPITHYLQSCGTWDGYDRIRALAQRIPTSWAHWEAYFHRWFLAMVAQWQQRSRDYGNSVVPMLIGRQGTHKSTFCKLILPPSLREYYIDDIKLDSAEQVERMISRMLLVNIDEYNAKTDREQAKIKRVLTECDVQTRKMRSDQYVMLPRMASFIATTNDIQPLTDPTGSRRYLCCEVTGIIDTETSINYQQMYAQAVSELDSGFPWFFSKEEEQDIEHHNMEYRLQTSPETVLLTYFEPAESCEENFWRVIDIQQTLRQHVRQADIPNIKKLALTLKACGFAHGKTRGQRGWYAKPLK